MPYRVEIKPSARRANGAVGVELNRRGARRAFDDRAAAEAWAADLADRGERRVWIRGAHPLDDSPADAYLVSRRPGAAEAPLARAYDKRRRRLRGGPGGEQSGLAAFASEQSLGDRRPSDRGRERGGRADRRSDERGARGGRSEQRRNAAGHGERSRDDE